MASDWKSPKGLKTNARSPGSITNAQHHDPSMSERDIAGSPGTPDDIISDAATAQVVPKGAILRVMNTNAAVQYIFIGKQSDVPGGAPDISTGIAIAPNFYENFYLGERKDGESIFIKASSNDVQVVVYEA